MASASESAGINILSWNINGLKAKFDEREIDLLNIFDQYGIVLLQETKIGKMQTDDDYDADWNYITDKLKNKYAFERLEDQTYSKRTDNHQKTMYMTYFRSDSRGVAIIINKPHNCLRAFCEDGDYAWVHVEIDNLKYTFVSVYYHPDANDSRSNLMEKIFTSLNSLNFNVLIGGDFNTTLHPQLDANKEIPKHAARRNILNKFMRRMNLSDVWRKKHGQESKFTYIHRQVNPPTMSRLDYIFMLKNDIDYVESCEILENIRLSDHFPVSLTVNMNTTNTNDSELTRPFSKLKF